MKKEMQGRQGGASLIEVMIAVLIMSIGLLGVAAMQATALKNSQSALERSQAVIESYAILDAIRANQEAGRNGSYTRGMTCSAPAGADLVNGDLGRWITSMKASLGADACGAVNCVAATRTCTVTVRWNDSRGTGGASAQEVVTVGRI
ncbi:type IV pilus modification protein PilV [Silanimonas sp.]|jgi:type IV pilus assembly protein PilV|uniref:type IV pilus modification protein PilV n=1 Tax=Silanimonas sp. TaxID=1929290 RepID=UPI0037C7040B